MSTSAHYLVSIVIPVYNDPGGIRATLNSLRSQEGASYEIIVVDNGSTDDTRDVIREYTKRYDHITMLVEDEVQGSYAARNKGIRSARGDILAFLDADETVTEHWLRNALVALEEQDVEYLGCRVNLCSGEETIVGQYNTRTGFPVEGYLEEEHYAPTCALFVRREVFDDVGLFDGRLISGGDREFGERVHEAGYAQGYAKDAVIYHPARTKFVSLVKKNFRVGRGFCQKQRYYPVRFGKPGIPPLPNGPNNGGNGSESESVGTRVAYAFLSNTMLLSRGLGYYYEFLFGKDSETPGQTE